MAARSPAGLSSGACPSHHLSPQRLLHHCGPPQWLLRHRPALSLLQQLRPKQGSHAARPAGPQLLCRRQMHLLRNAATLQLLLQLLHLARRCGV